MRRRTIDNYEISWRLAVSAVLLMATQLIALLPAAARDVEAGASTRQQTAVDPTANDDAAALFARARELTEQKRNNEALELYQLLIASHPGIPEAHYNLGLLYLRLGQYDKAETTFNQALRIRPGYAAAYENLGDAHVRMALRAWSTAARLDPAELAAGAKYRALLPAAELAGSPSHDLPGRRNATGGQD